MFLADKSGRAMLNANRTDSVRRLRHLWSSAAHVALAVLAFTAAQILLVNAISAHEGHDHDTPAPLSLPVAPRVIAVTPDYELVGVLSGRDRLTIFLHHFETGEPVKNAKLTVSVDASDVEAVAKDDGVFEVSASWLASTQPIDILFKLTLSDDQDILTGRLEKASTADPIASRAPASAGQARQLVYVAIAALMTGALAALWLSSGLARRRKQAAASAPINEGSGQQAESASNIKRLHRIFLFLLLTAVPTLTWLAIADTVGAQDTRKLPTVPSTMATDQPQRMPDGSLFVPMATQHLLSVRTLLTKESKSPRTVELVGTIIADPNSFGRVQSGHAGRIDPPEGGLAYVGKRIEKGDLLAYLTHHIEAYNKGSLQGEIAELEARIVLQENKLALYRKHPQVIPVIKIVEAEGELRALRQKRNELLPTLSDREEVRAPISGVISTASVVPGQVVDAREVVFEIVDPSRFWVEAIAHDLSVIANLSQAVAVTNSGEKLPLEFAGAGLSLKQQAAPLTFRVTQTSPNLSIGRPVTVILQSTVEVNGIPLPASSVVRASTGLWVVWVKTEPERFEPRTIRYEPLDGQRVVVLAGLKPDLRVVTEGATLLNQIR
jgi:membrane fusion protein, heavy metal efflux system